MTCTSRGAADNGQGGLGSSKVLRLWSSAAAEEEVSIV